MPNDPATIFYHDVEEEQRRWAISLIKKCTLKTMADPLTNAAYLQFPVTYLFCENDKAIDIATQKQMVENIEKSTGIKIDKETCDASHSPFYSQPEVLLKLVNKIAQVS
jgi:hypothetical protein